jgi:hypothetical protein
MKTCICAILLLLIILIKTYSKDLELLCENINIICGIFFILFLPVQNKYKIPFLCLFIWRWNININLFYTMIYIMFNHKQIYSETNLKIRRIITNFFRTNFKFVTNFGKLPTIPCIIVANYITDRVENFVSITIPLKISIISRDWIINYSKLDKIVSGFIIRYKDGGTYNSIKTQIADKISQKYCVFSYVSKGKNQKYRYITKIRSGMFRIANELQVPIVPVCIDYIDSVYGAIPKQRFEIRVGNMMFVNDIKKSINIVRKFFVKTFEEMKLKKYDI